MRLVSLEARRPFKGIALDKRGGVIQNLLALDSGILDSRTLLEALGQLSDGVPAYWGARKRGTETLGTHIVKVINPWLSDEGIRADIELGAHAATVPGMGGNGSAGDVGAYLMDLIDYDPSALRLFVLCDPSPFEIKGCELSGT